MKVLLKNKDMSPWTSIDMSGIHLTIMSHELAIFKESRLISQKKHKLGEDFCKPSPVLFEPLLTHSPITPPSTGRPHTIPFDIIKLL